MLLATDILPQSEVPVRWRLATRVAFRWCVVYFPLYVCFTRMLSAGRRDVASLRRQPIKTTVPDVMKPDGRIRTSPSRGHSSQPPANQPKPLAGFSSLVFRIRSSVPRSLTPRERPRYHAVFRSQTTALGRVL